MGRRVTLKDVAVEAGVSAAAVSLVLNHRPNRVSAEKQEEIFAAARKLSYVPNQSARSLVTSKSMMLALLLPDIENLFFASLAKSLEDIYADEGYSLIIANSDDSRSNEQSLMRMLASRSIDGLFIIPAYESLRKSDEIRQDIEQLGCPTVLVDRMVNQQWCDAVSSDNWSGGERAAELLIESGHTKIGIIAGEKNSDNSQDRQAGFLSYLKKHQIYVPAGLQVYGDYRFAGGYAAADTLLDAGVTAVFCCNDLMALGFIERARERNVEVPGDVSVVGYDNVVGRLGMGVSLTSFDQNIPAISKAAHDIMEHRMQHRGAAYRAQLIAPHLVQRGTVRAL